jgi:hypothetical protein
MAFVVIEKAGSRIFPIVVPFPSRRAADTTAKKQSPHHGGKITVKPVRQTVPKGGPQSPDVLRKRTSEERADLLSRAAHLDIRNEAGRCLCI